MQDLPDITQLIPQRYPFLFIDRIIAYEPQVGLTAMKNISVDEWALQPQAGCSTQALLSSYPGVFLIEGAAQTAAAFFQLAFQEDQEARIVLLGKVTAEFFAPVRPGQQVFYKTGIYKMLKNGGYIDILAETGDQKVAAIKIFCGF
jgi:3-hydroxyacyl-[acyl-carrier-protein] dehydratase